jgi:chaperonin GroEL (HSP60 family)
MVTKKAGKKAKQYLKEIAEQVAADDKPTLLKIANTSMQTKLIRKDSDKLADIVVQAVLAASVKDGENYTVDIDDIKVEKKPGGSISDSSILQGIVLDKEIVHSGMPKKVTDSKIALINTALEIEKTEIDAKINISTPEQMKSFLDEENKMLKNMVDKITNVGATVVFCQKGIDDMSQHYLDKA